MSESKMLRSLVDAHRLPIDPDGLSESLGSAISEEKADLHAGRTRNTEIRIERVWKRLFPERSRGELERIALEYELAVNPVWPMPGCRRCIEYLGRLQMTLGLVSNAQFYTPLLFHALLGADPIGLGFTPGICLYSYVHGIAKPDPSLFEIAAARLSRMGIRREETLMVGNDLINDIEPAMRTGFLAVLFGGELPGSPVRPTARISRLGDLKELIEGAPRP
jgi:putative hydrolase of the HAD superfamily